MAAHDRTPLLVGVGQYTDHMRTERYAALSPQAIAAHASAAALADTGCPEMARHLDVIAAVRTVADSVTDQQRELLAPFGGPDNFPRAVANRIGANPRLAIYSVACGDEPQVLVAEMSQRIRSGECEAALLCGAEAAGTTRSAQREGRTIDWSERVGGQCEDRGKGTGDLLAPEMETHGMEMPLWVYPLFENRRRHLSGQSSAAYAAGMGRLLERFNRVAVENPFAEHREPLSAGQISAVSRDNRLVSEPYTKWMVAKDAVNQGAALVLVSAGLARQLGIPEERWVHPLGHAQGVELPVLDRPDLADSPMLRHVYRTALQRAGISADSLSHFDLYSCFPIVVSLAMEALGITDQDPRPLTVTGGLPFFGGPGNNYSMHAIASMVERLRNHPGSIGLVGTNGGYLSRHAVGIYSSHAPVNGNAMPGSEVPLTLAQAPAPLFEPSPSGHGVIESFAVLPGHTGAIIGRLASSGRRFVARCRDAGTVHKRMLEADPIGQSVEVRPSGDHAEFSFIDA
jgi:acetyl-CoA C-acetyltransferase